MFIQNFYFVQERFILARITLLIQKRFLEIMLTFVSNPFLHCLLIAEFLYDFLNIGLAWLKLEFFECLYCESILYHVVLWFFMNFLSRWNPKFHFSSRYPYHGLISILRSLKKFPRMYLLIDRFSQMVSKAPDVIEILYVCFIYEIIYLG